MNADQLHALADLADHAKGKTLRLDEIDGQAAAQSAWKDLLRGAGFVEELDGLSKLGRIGARI